MRLEDKIDYGVGLRLHAKIGDQVKAGDQLVMAYFNDESKFEEMGARLRAAYRIGESAPKSEPLIKVVV